MTKKYRLTDTTIEHKGRTLYQIQALIDIPYHGVLAGDLGGYVESERNLSQTGDAWIANNAKVYDRAHVSCNALICGEAEAFENAKVSGYAFVSYYAKIYGSALISSHAVVDGKSRVFGKANVSGYANISGYAELSDFVRVSESAIVFGHPKLSGKTIVKGNVRVSSNARLEKFACIYGSSYVGKDALITEAHHIFHAEGLTIYKSVGGLMAYIHFRSKLFEGSPKAILKMLKEAKDVAPPLYRDYNPPLVYRDYKRLVKMAKRKILGDQINNQEVLIN